MLCSVGVTGEQVHVELWVDVFSSNTTSQICSMVSGRGEDSGDIPGLGVVLLSLVAQILGNLLAITWPWVAYVHMCGFVKGTTWCRPDARFPGCCTGLRENM